MRERLDGKGNDATPLRCLFQRQKTLGKPRCFQALQICLVLPRSSSGREYRNGDGRGDHVHHGQDGHRGSRGARFRRGAHWSSEGENQRDYGDDAKRHDGSGDEPQEQREDECGGEDADEASGDRRSSRLQRWEIGRDREGATTEPPEYEINRDCNQGGKESGLPEGP
jgi:hypothetical protein